MPRLKDTISQICQKRDINLLASTEEAYLHKKEKKQDDTQVIRSEAISFPFCQHLIRMRPDVSFYVYPTNQGQGVGDIEESFHAYRQDHEAGPQTQKVHQQF